jgi:curved DNA-binding protein CbpA
LKSYWCILIFKNLIKMQKINKHVFNFYKLTKRRLLDFDPNKDYYKILGINQTASEKEIKEAYYKLAKKYHPDLNQGKTNEQFKEMTAAYDILSSTEKRKQYDSSRSFNTFYSGKQYSAGQQQQRSSNTYNTRAGPFGSGDFRDDPFFKNFDNMFKGGFWGSQKAYQQDYKSNFRDSQRMNFRKRYYNKNKDYFSTFKATSDSNEYSRENKPTKFGKKYFEKNKKYYETFKTDGTSNKNNFSSHQGDTTQSHSHENAHKGGSHHMSSGQMSGAMYFVLTFFGIFMGSIIINSLLRGGGGSRPGHTPRQNTSDTYNDSYTTRSSEGYHSDPYRK